MSLTFQENVKDLSTEDLIGVIQREHESVQRSLANAVNYAINAGHALLVVKSRLPRGSWEPWLRENSPVSIQHAYTYMRFAKNETVIIESGVHSIRAGRRILAERTAEDRARADNPETDPVLAGQAVAMKRDGFTNVQISEELGVPVRTISRWTRNKRQKVAEYKRERARKRKASKALQRERTQREARRLSSNVDEGYALLRKCLIAMQNSLDEEMGQEARACIGRAMSSLFNAEDEIAKAIRVWQLKG